MTFLVQKQCQGIQHGVVYVHLNECLCPFQPSHGTYDIKIPPKILVIWHRGGSLF